MTPSELSAIAARADAATPGPWFWADEAMYANAAPTPETRDDAGWDWRSGQPRQIAPIRLIETDSGYYPPREKDRAFLAAARSDVPALVAEVRRLQAAVEALTPLARLGLNARQWAAENMQNVEEVLEIARQAVDRLAEINASKQDNA